MMLLLVAVRVVGVMDRWGAGGSDGDGVFSEDRVVRVMEYLE